MALRLLSFSKLPYSWADISGITAPPNRTAQAFVNFRNPLSLGKPRGIPDYKRTALKDSSAQCSSDYKRTALKDPSES